MRDIILVVRGTPVRCSVDRRGDQFDVRIGDAVFQLQLTRWEPGVLGVSTSGRARLARVAHAQGRNFLHVDGYTVEYSAPSKDDRGADRRTPVDTELSAPMPGTVTQVLTKEGDEVVRGQPLVIVEAMKMEHVIRAPRAGIVNSVRARAGDQVGGGAVLVELARTSDEAAR
jgi:3-methylcrotonyl-CoA carboxylase alpha subunit